jgi:hypothetical protein
MIKRLKRIAPVKFGLVVGILYGLISLIFIPFFLIAAAASFLAPHTNSTMPAGVPVALGMVLVCVMLPIFYAVIGGLFGLLGAWLYNVVASWVGGIEFEVE